MRHSTFTCDSVFEVLTRGPFPSGAEEDDHVEQHLAACHECRCLAEALRPAVALMHECVAESEADELPRYQGSATPQWAQNHWPSQSAVPAENRYGFTRAGVKAVAALLAGVVVLAAVLHWSAPPRHREKFSHHDNQAHLTTEGAELLISMALDESCAPAARLALAFQGMDLNVLDQALECCTQCHGVSRSRSLSSYAMHSLAKSCRACHG